MANEDFENFKDQCVEQLSALQDEFMKAYDIGLDHLYLKKFSGYLKTEENGDSIKNI